jgi:DNA primase
VHREEHLPCSVCRADLRALAAAVKTRIGPDEAVRMFGLEKGSKPQRNGRSVLCPSPSHSEDDPSCSLTFGRDRTLRVHCFGCALSGDVFDLAAAVWGLDRDSAFPKLARDLAERIGLSTDPRAPLPPLPPQRVPRPSPLALEDEDFAAVVAPLLHLGRLDGSAISADVCSYLGARGLLDLARADGWTALPPREFQPAWLETLTDAARPGPGYSPTFTTEDVRRSGLFRDTGFAHPENRLCVPFRDRAGHVVNLQRRRLDGEKRHKYAFPDGRPLAVPYGVDRLDAAPADAPIFYVEGAVDVLVLRAILAERGEAGAVIGIPGVSHWREPWGAYARGRVAIVAFDTDAAGEGAVSRVADDLVSGGAVRVERWKPPEGFKDWGDVWTVRAAGKEAA